MKKIVIVALASAFVAAPAFADSTGKFYIAGDLGSAQYDNMEPFDNPGVVRIAGGYHFSPNVAAEIGYSQFGDSTVTGPGIDVTLKAHSFQIAVVGSLPLSSSFDLIGKLGLSRNSAKVSGYIIGFGSGSESTSQSSLLIGVGAQYHFTPQWSLRAQYDDYGKFDNVSPEMKASSFSLGVAYNF